ncbi:ABC transporter ATP-binding protein [Desulfosporosinus sp. BICA1-9]|uniref:ABC transporter ATP-binding protein n=1 Tax=Desulfosporosinus sp. BICA1-9 TaxID=1531958 RepID=UPI00054C714A|nr:ABC transporter ATP-binding protein [Desulfosporosinus sp. BICA1-9]KJS45950.1 MAG: multidrug ABC transporter ATP-binding protein [Peptococcaceae bacterium BRH_c23]KJS90543.1 MAG: multidrug ABC transporter ATP-binding protein [Desulfosporosinus sp. BICA1-9]HBW36804.1 ABC transporter ATP-binding protein [Desulfosporosinus sp.]
MLKLFRFMKPYTAHIAVVIGLLFVQVLSDLYLPTLMADIVDYGIVNKDVPYIIKIGGLMLIIAAGGTVCAIIASYLSSKTAVGFGKIVREKIFNKVESFSLQEFDKLGTATLITRTTNDVTQVQQVSILILSMMVTAPLMSIGGIVMALQQDKSLAWVLVVVIPVLFGIIGITLFRGMPLFKVMQEKLDRLNLVLRENLTGIRVIRAFNRIDKEKVRFDHANQDIMDNAIKINVIMAVLMPMMMLIMNLTTVALVWFGAIRIDLGDMQMGSLLAFIQYATQILFSLLMLVMLFIMIPRAQVSAVRINEVLDTNLDIKDPQEPRSVNSERGLVEFKDVSFRYPGADQPAVSNISFSAKAGEVTAIIGGTGSGKSTLIHLLTRFYDVEHGSVLVDGIDVRDMRQQDLRAKIGFVPQKTFLFTGTIAENIKYGKEEATLEEIKHAAQVAQATEFILGMEAGFDHNIAQGGTNISGGQKQRLSIARALVRKPKIYLFDDSFSALDFKTDARLRAALKPEIAKATVFIVAQSVSTVRDADRIIVLDDGQITGIGTHKELLKTCMVYREIVASQLAEEEVG